MALNDNIIGLVDSLAKDDISKAKAYAKCVVANEKSAKHMEWCKKRYKDLTSSAEVEHLEIPSSIKGKCQLIDAVNKFNYNRYYLRDSEKKLADKIIKRDKVCGEAELLGVKMPNSTLLYGKPGVGKSLFAQYVAWRLNKPLLYLRFSELIDSYMGKTSDNIGKIFDFANNNDMILMLDEIDTVARRRDGEGGCDGELSRVTVTIMQELDNLRSGVIVLAATNRMDVLDDALFRRFSFIYEMEGASEKDRRCMVEKWWGSLGKEAPFDVVTYVKEDKSLSDINRDMVEYLATELEASNIEASDVKERLTDIPQYYKNVFLYVAEHYNNPQAELLTVYNNYYYFLDLIRQDDCIIVKGAQDEKIYEMKYAVLVARIAYLEETHEEPRLWQIEKLYRGSLDN